MLQPSPNGKTSIKVLEDPLSLLPRKPVNEYSKGSIIYNCGEVAHSIHLVIDGLVRVSLPRPDNTQMVVDIVAADHFFGEVGLLQAASRKDRAVALEDTKIMAWTAVEIEEHIARQPRLGLALLQVLVQRVGEFEVRLETCALDKTLRRLGRTLIGLAERMGTVTPDGGRQIPPLTHQLISEYVGTSREIVTSQMNMLRKRGFIRYSRKNIVVYGEALRECMRLDDESVMLAAAS